MLDTAVVVATRNPDPTRLDRAIESIHRQTWPASVIIVDDGSVDEKSLAFLSEISSSADCLIVQPWSGVSAARNRGIRSADASFVMCLDDDDWLESGYISQCRMLLEADPQAGYAYTGTRIHSSQGERTWNRTLRSPLQLLLDNPIPYAALMRFEAWQETGGYAEEMIQNGYEDWDLWLAMTELGWRGQHASDVLFHYTRSNVGRLARSNLKRRENMSLLRQRHPALYSWRYASRQIRQHPVAAAWCAADALRNSARVGRAAWECRATRRAAEAMCRIGTIGDGESVD